MQSVTGSLQTTVQQRIVNFLQGQRQTNSIVLAGPDYESKKNIAKNISKAFLCRQIQTSFCGECSVCRRIEMEIHPDVISIGNDGEPIKIETVREICHQMEVPPLESSAKFCIIEDCHRLNVFAANAFLKTLEEPGPLRFFLLLTSQPDSLLPTILSRCIKFTLHSNNEKVDVESSAFFQEAFSQFLKEKKPRDLLAKIQNQEAAFALYLQKHLRDWIIDGLGPDNQDNSSIGPSLFDLLNAFDGACALEGRLRSNAHSGLITEAYLIENFLK